MHFRRLMLLSSGPMYWGNDVSHAADQLRSFLVHIFSPDAAGSAWLRPRASDTWIEGVEAYEWIRNATDTVASVAAVVDKEGPSDSLFDKLVEQAAEVFLPPIRVESVLALPPSLSASLRDVSCGFSIDWSEAGTIAWTPQLRFYNYWPRSRRLAPTEPASIPQPATHDPAAAALLLEDVLYRAMRRAFNETRDSFGLRFASLKLSGNDLVHPVFYFASPEEGIERPEDWLSGTRLDAVHEFTRANLNSPDPKSRELTWGVFRGRLLVARRDLRVRDQVHQLYLFLPSGGGADATAESEWLAAVAADTLAYIHFANAGKASRILGRADALANSIALWSALVGEGVATTERLQRRAVLSGSERRETYMLMSELQLALARLSADVAPGADEAGALGRQLDEVSNSGAEFARNTLDVRNVPDFAPLVLRDLGPEPVLRERLQSLSERAMSLAATFDSVAESLSRALSVRREQVLESDERNQRRLTYVVGALAAIAAFPLLVGEPEWSGLTESLRRLPFLFAASADVLDALRPAITLFAVVAAAALVTAAFVVVVRVKVPQVVNIRRGVVMDARRIREGILKAWDLCDDAEPIANEVLTSSSRRELDRLDEHASSYLVAAWDWLIANRTAAPPKSEATRARTERFVVSVELLAKRPATIPLLASLCLMRFKSGDLVPYPVVADDEFSRILGLLEFTPIEYDGLLNACAELRTENAGTFVGEIRRRFSLQSLSRAEVLSDRALNANDVEQARL